MAPMSKSVFFSRNRPIVAWYSSENGYVGFNPIEIPPASLLESGWMGRQSIVSYRNPHGAFAEVYLPRANCSGFKDDVVPRSLLTRDKIRRPGCGKIDNPKGSPFIKPKPLEFLTK